jgi:hypothetical protein
MSTRRERFGEDMALYGTVLKIFDETCLLIDLGRNEGIERGDRFVVVEKGGGVVEPKSGEQLGELEHVKIELVAVDVQERMSVLMTELEEGPSGSLPLSARMVRDSVKGERGAGRRIRMAVAPGEMEGKPSPSPVRKGDMVRKAE